MLPKFKEQNQLLAVTSDLLWMLRDGEPWSKYYEDNLRSISENAWADLSVDQDDRIRDIVNRLSANNEDERMREAADDLQQVMIHLNSPEIRQLVFNNLKTQAEDPKVIARARELGYTTENLIPTFHKGMYQLLSGDPETFVGRTSYLRLPSDVLQSMFSGVVYLLCCFILETKEKIESGVPLEERVISVSELLKFVDQCQGTDLALRLCEIIALSIPNLSQQDLDLLRSKFGQDPITGQSFKECTFTGNNIIESIQKSTACRHCQ